MLVIRFLYVFISSVLSVMLFNCYFDKKNSLTVKREWFILVLLSLLEASVKNQFNHTVINLLSTASITFFICFIFYDGKPEVKLLVSSFILLINMFLDILSILPVTTLLKLNMEMSGVQPLVIIITAFPFCLSKLMVVHIVRRKRMKTANVGDRNSYYQQMIIPACSIIYSIYYIYIGINGPYFHLSQCYITIIFLTGINIIHYIIFENKERLYLENYNNLLLQQTYEYREEYYRNLEKYQEEIRIIKHDLKNQLIRIAAYDDHQAKKKIEQMIDNLVKKDEAHFTRNPGINSLLSVKYNDTLKKNIQCSFSVHIPENMGIDERDLTGLVGNIIDNAIEAAEKCSQDKWLRFDMTYYNHLLAIRCENSTTGQVNNFNTTKKNIAEHGLGLKSIHKIVEMYHGSCEYKTGEDSLVLELNIWSQT